VFVKSNSTFTDIHTKLTSRPKLHFLDIVCDVVGASHVRTNIVA